MHGWMNDCSTAEDDEEDRFWALRDLSSYVCMQYDIAIDLEPIA